MNVMRVATVALCVSVHASAARDDAHTGAQAAARLDAVHELITKCIHPRHWTSHGGTLATLEYRNEAWHVELHQTSFDHQSGTNPHDIVRDVEAFVRHYQPILDGQPREIVRASSLLGYQDSAEEARTLALLEQRRVNVACNETPLSEALSTIERQSGLVIEPDWGPLSMIGIAPDSVITLRADHQPIGEVLWSICRTLGYESDRPLLQLDRGRVVVTSEHRARRHTGLAVYNVHDLIELILRAIPPRPDGTRPVATIIDREEMICPMINLVQEYVDPEGWRDLGGDTSTLIAFDEYLFIQTTPANHRAIMRLLGAMRDASDEDAREVSVGPLDHRAQFAGLETRVYDVLDLLHAPFRREEQHEVAWSETRHEHMTRQLIDMLQDFIDPEHWRVLGGRDGSLWPHAGLFFITTTPRNHDRIGALLEALRQAVNQPRRIISAETDDPHQDHEAIEIRLYPIIDLLSALHAVVNSEHERSGWLPNT